MSSSRLAQAPATMFRKNTIIIPSATAGWNLDAWTYIPTDRPAPHPVIIMAHGWGANKLMSISEYAEAYTAIGYACVLFDYRRWGASDGTPRHLLIIPEQLDDYRTVIKYVRQQQEFDPQRVVVWGISFSGGHAISLASEPSLNLKAVMAQCPFTGTSQALTPNFTLFKTVCYAIADTIKQGLGLDPVYMKAASGPGRVGGMTTQGSEEGVSSLCKDKADWPNEINAGIMLQVPFYKPYSTATSIACPTLVVALEDDDLCTLEGAEIVARSSNAVQLLKIPQSGHFDIYPSRVHYDLSLNTQLEFLKKHVPV